VTKVKRRVTPDPSLLALTHQRPTQEANLKNLLKMEVEEDVEEDEEDVEDVAEDLVLQEQVEDKTRAKPPLLRTRIMY
jgi:hypothetical protein